MTATIKQLKIHRFRGVESLTWCPHPRLNLIVGAADFGKSTILEAIALLFSPSPNYGLSEFDYYARNVDAGFTIEAVISISDMTLLRDDGFPAPPMRGWLGNKLTDLPDEGGAEPVLAVRLTGTGDQEASYEVIGAGDDNRISFTRSMRRRIGIARLGVADRGDRDIRLVQGGALDRYLQGQDVRQTVLQAVMKTPLHDQLEQKPKQALETISDGFAKRGLPNPLRLGLVGTPGVSLAASVGLTVGNADPDALPLAAWGTGTRRLAALEISTLGISADAIAVIDEPETGLEPYRQRVFIRDLAAHPRQAFVTTHAPAVLSQSFMETSFVWRIGKPKADPKATVQISGEESVTPQSHALFPVEGTDLKAIAGTQPEALFARLPIICEGITEVGFAARVLETRFGTGYSCRGLFCLDAGGHYKALPICQALLGAGFPLAAIVDDEGKRVGSWSDVSAAAALLRWESGACLEAAVLSALPGELLKEAHLWVEETLHRDARHQLSEIRGALGLEKGPTAEEMYEQVGHDRYLAALLSRACPKPEGKRKPRGWFKTFAGGYLLATKLLSASARPSIMEQIMASI